MEERSHSYHLGSFRASTGHSRGKSNDSFVTQVFRRFRHSKSHSERLNTEFDKGDHPEGSSFRHTGGRIRFHEDVDVIYSQRDSLPDNDDDKPQISSLPHSSMSPTREIEVNANDSVIASLTTNHLDNSSPIVNSPSSNNSFCPGTNMNRSGGSCVRENRITRQIRRFKAWKHRLKSGKSKNSAPLENWYPPPVVGVIQSPTPLYSSVSVCSTVGEEQDTVDAQLPSGSRPTRFGLRAVTHNILKRKCASPLLEVPASEPDNLRTKGDSFLEDDVSSRNDTNSVSEFDLTEILRGGVWCLDLHLLSGKDLVVRDSSGTSDPYIKFKYKGKTLGRSRVVSRNLNPVWDEHFSFYADSLERPLEIRVYDHDTMMTDDYMGRALLNLQDLIVDNVCEKTLQLADETGKSKESYMGSVRFSCRLYRTVVPSEGEQASLSGFQGAQMTLKQTLEKSKFFRALQGDSSRKAKSNLTTATVTIVLVHGRCLLPFLDTGTADPFVKIRLAKEKAQSKICKRTLHPRWSQQFSLRLLEDSSSILDLTVWHRDTAGKSFFMGRCTVDLGELPHEKTHRLKINLDDSAGRLCILVTISGLASSQLTELRDHAITEADRERLLAKYSIYKTIDNVSDVGWLQVKVLKAQGLQSADLNGKSDPYCVVELVNSRLQTHTEYKTLDPEWQKVFVFNVTDIHTPLEVTVWDEDKDRMPEFLGKISIPLLKIRNGESRWYALKDAKLNARVKGAVLLEMDLIYNHMKAAYRTVNPAEIKYITPETKLKLSNLKRNISRVSRIIDAFIRFFNFIDSCWEWESPPRSLLAFFVYLVVVYNFELYMLPLTIMMIVIKEYIFSGLITVINKKQDRLVGVHDEDSLNSGSDDDEDPGDKDGKSTTWKERFNSARDVLIHVQEYLDEGASFFERIHNAFTWEVPWLTWMAVICLLMLTLVLYLIPMRWLLLVWGVNKFTKKILRPNASDNIEPLDFLSRVPSDVELTQYKELKPLISTSATQGSFGKRR